VNYSTNLEKVKNFNLKQVKIVRKPQKPGDGRTFSYTGLT
jgi:hypothetical protein